MLTAINHITLAVSDVEKSFNFYKDILGFTPLVKWDGGAYFLLQNEEQELWFCLNLDTTRIPNNCYTHYAFSVTEHDFPAVAAKIRESGTIVFKQNQSPGTSLYFLDPDGHKLEIHTQDWQTRIKTKKSNPGTWKNIHWYI